jgi:DNA-binding transcriptional ArsR family regulator
MFHALADPTRRDILVRTLQDEYSVSGLARLYPMTFAAVQKHVAVLAGAGLVTKRRSGREQLVSGNIETVRRASGLLDEMEAVWRARLERFDNVLQEKDDVPQERGTGDMPQERGRDDVPPRRDTVRREEGEGAE